LEGFRVFDLESWPLETGGAPLLDAESARTLLRRFSGDPDAMRTLRAFLADAGTMRVGHLTDHDVVEHVAHAVGRGRFAIAERLTPPPPVAETEAEPEAETAGSASEPPPTPEVTWIEVELVGEDDQPIAGERYRLTLSTGRVLEGALDVQGRVRIEGMKPGTFDLTFPRLDQEAWNRA
jgi:hypothetical protein